MSIIHVSSVSGVKDFAATLLFAIERYGANRVRGLFCYTGNEHQAVYDYLDYREVATGVMITRLKENCSLELSLNRARHLYAPNIRHTAGLRGRLRQTGA